MDGNAENLKLATDGAFICGVNRLILHTCPLQPWNDDVKPGVTMGRWGTHFGRNQTWAECGKPWFDYMARCQALLQWGEPSERTLDIPGGVKQIARTDRTRTLFFVVAGSNAVTRLDLPRGKWFDPVSGRMCGVPSRLAPRQSGFYEEDAAAPGTENVRRVRLALTAFEPAIGDRSKSPDSAVRYFSGTLTYRTTFDRPHGAVRLALQVMTFEQVVTVRLNGVVAGIIWCAPWNLELPSVAMKEHCNLLELDVTNSWRNRLIGDEQEPADCTFEKAPMTGGSFLSCYPDWFGKGLVARPSKRRKCFTTWNYFTKDSPLMSCGLLEAPVLLWELN
ncbi:MAG: hypothetical protein KBT68_00465 [bacterium]|nr:hypothetical protein [Candidatus Colisoma equi]